MISGINRLAASSVVAPLNCTNVLRRASQKLAAIGKLAGGIAHDLNQALVLIAGHNDQARQALVDASPDLTELQDLLTTSTRAAVDGGEIVKRLLLLRQAAPEPERQPLDLSAMWLCLRVPACSSLNNLSISVRDLATRPNVLRAVLGELAEG